jgi:hypothetical protein
MKRIWIFSGVLAAGFAATGCNIGNAPEPMSGDEARAAVEKLSPEQQIEWINRSPMPPAEKQKKIDEIKAKHGLQGGANATSAPGAPAIPGN